MTSTYKSTICIHKAHTGQVPIYALDSHKYCKLTVFSNLTTADTNVESQTGETKSQI